VRDVLVELRVLLVFHLVRGTGPTCTSKLLPAFCNAAIN
jgi:hypothetical protein